MISQRPPPILPLNRVRHAAAGVRDWTAQNVDWRVVDAPVSGPSDGGLKVTDPMVGRLIDGRYQVVEQIARGGMATVYRATDTRLDRIIALKVMHPGFAEDPAFVNRFTREARAAARLSDPHIVAVFDQGEDAGTVFLAMEYIPGRTLRDLLGIKGRLSPREAVNVMTPVLQALAAAHRSGLVHRDVKPENVLIGDDGRVRVADFGLARAANGSGADNATRGVLIGTVAYLAPEQVQPGVSDERSDVYAAGILLYELLTGSPPFDGDEPMSVAYRHVHETVPAPSTSVAGIPESLDAVVLAATQRDPANRPENAAGLLRMLRAVQIADEVASDARPTIVVPLPSHSEVPASTRPKDTTVSPVPVVSTAGSAAAKPPAEPAVVKKRRARGWIALALVLALAIGAGVFAWWLGPASNTSVPTVAGLEAKAAEAKLSEAGLEFAYGNEKFSEIVPAGEVISSDPDSGAQVSNGSTVTLILSKGKERYDVPKVIGLTVPVARDKLNKQNLVIGKKSKEYSDSVDKGVIISSTPNVGKSVRKDTAVNLVVSRGPQPINVPNVTGKSVADARSSVEGVGLQLTISDRKYNGSVAAGSVISQSPSSSGQLTAGGAVSVVVSRGPRLAEVPGVVRRSTDDAKSLLTNAGFKVSVNEQCVIFCVGRVVEQTPSGGTQAPVGSTVTITIV